MFVRVSSTPNSPRKSIKVVASIREGFKVKQVMIHHVGIASTHAEIEKLKQLGREFIAKKQLEIEHESGQLSLFATDTLEQRLQKIQENNEFKNAKKRGRKPATKLADISDDETVNVKNLVEELRIIDGIHDVAGYVFDQLGYSNLMERKKDREILRDVVLMRLANPGSKFQAQRLLNNRFSRTHDLDAIYRMMDKLFPKISDMKAKTFERAQKIIPDTIDILFFDCTTLYFESTETDELRRFGYSKDHRFNTTQVVLALATNGDGLPLGYELFEGNKAEVSTLISCLDSWGKQFKINTVCFVADRAMMSEANLSLLNASGHQYIIAAKLRGMKNALREEILSEKNYHTEIVGNDLGWVGEFSYKTSRLVVSYKSDRAKRDVYQREKIVNKINKSLGCKGDTEKLITNKGVKKFTTTGQSESILDERKIIEDAAWDGLHGVLTNIKDMPAAEVLGRYARLWKIEESFRLNKHTLSMRPIFHFKADRIHSHIAICYMAFTVLRHMEYVVNLTQKISPQMMLEELKGVESSILKDSSTGKRYRIASRFSHNASKIYKAFGLVRDIHTKAVV